MVLDPADFQGDCWAVRHYDADLDDYAVSITKADPFITISRELIDNHDERHMVIVGDLVKLPGYTYRMLGRTARGDVMAELIP